MDGLSRMSSVLGLKVRPSMAMVLPATLPSSAAMTLRAIARLRCVVDGDDGLDEAQRRAVVLAPSCISASVSFGKQEPPKPGPACRNFGPMRLSRPMPRATSCTSAPAFSQRSAISLMKVILVARKALAAYLISSDGAPRGEQERRLVQIERPVDLGHDLARALVLGADDDAVGTLEVLDRRALAQEFGIGHDGEVGVGPRLADDALDLVAGSDRNGRFRDDHGKAVDAPRRSRAPPRRHRRGRHVRRPAATACRPRRTRHRRSRTGFGKLGREGQPLLVHIAGDDLVEARLVDRHLARSRASILAGSLSMQVTTWPKSAKQAPVTSPT